MKPSAIEDYLVIPNLRSLANYKSFLNTTLSFILADLTLSSISGVSLIVYLNSRQGYPFQGMTHSVVNEDRQSTDNFSHTATREMGGIKKPLSTIMAEGNRLSEPLTWQ